MRSNLRCNERGIQGRPLPKNRAPPIAPRRGTCSGSPLEDCSPLPGRTAHGGRHSAKCGRNSCRIQLPQCTSEACHVRLSEKRGDVLVKILLVLMRHLVGSHRRMSCRN